MQWGTRPEQRSVRATLATLGGHELASPSVIVVGEVAGHDLGWFESRPLFGRKVVVTRAREQASTLSASLRALGATVVELPTIEIVEPADGGEALHGAVHEVSMLRYEWVVFTSANAVRRFFAEVPDSRVLGGVRVAAVGSATAAVLRSYRVVADLVPTAFDDTSLLGAFPDPPAAGSRRVLFPVPRSPATCSPTAYAPAAGRSRWSTPTAPSRWRPPNRSGPRRPAPTPSPSRRRRP